MLAVLYLSCLLGPTLLNTTHTLFHCVTRTLDQHQDADVTGHPYDHSPSHGNDHDHSHGEFLHIAATSMANNPKDQMLPGPPSRQAGLSDHYVKKNQQQLQHSRMMIGILNRHDPIMPPQAYSEPFIPPP